MSSEVEEIKNRLDIVDVIGEYVTLKPGGANFKAVCPFHQEKTPSFMVNRERQFWHCFGCDQGGDVFAFVQKIENMEFIEALRLLAAKAGVELQSYDPRAQSERTRLHDIHTRATEFFHSLLFQAQGKGALEYLTHKRKLTPETIRVWKLGYAPDEWRALLGHLLGLKFTEKELIASGLALSSQGRTYDRFRNRVMFPIVSPHGQVVGFSARALSSDPNEPKYINSPQTLIYDKGKTLFGLFQARGAIREKNAAILVEGNMDVIASSQSGVAHVVAASGTGLTAGHLNLLSRFTKELHVCFDADAAGLRASERGITLALSAGFFVKVIPLVSEVGPPRLSEAGKEGSGTLGVSFPKDPADIVENDPAAWARLAVSAVPVMEYVLGRVAREENLRDVEDRRKAFMWITGWLSKMSEPVEQDFYVKKASGLLELDETIVRRALHPVAVKKRDEAAVTQSNQRPFSQEVQTTERLFSLALQRNEYFDYVIVNCQLEHIPQDYATLYKLLVSYYTVHKSVTQVHEVSAFLRQEHQQLEHLYLTLLTRGEENLAFFANEELVYQEMKRLMARLRMGFFEAKKQELSSLIRQKEMAGDSAALNSLLEQFQTISEHLAHLDA